MIRLRAPIPYQRAATYSAMLRPPSLSDMTSAAAAKSIKSLFSAADQRVIKLVIGAKPRYSLLDSAQIFVLFSAVALTSMSALPLLLLALVVVPYLEDMGTSAAVTVTTILGFIYLVPIGTIVGLHASGWVPWTKSVGSILVCACALFAATAAHRLGAARASALLLRTCAPWALLHGLTPLGPAGALLLTGACKAALYAAGAACHAPAPPLASGIRVLMTGDSFAPKLDGPQILTNNMVRGLIGMGHKVHVFCSNGYPGIEYGPELAGATVTRGPGVEVFPKHKVTLPSPWFVWALLRCRPHLVHFVDLTPANILTLPVAWLLGIPCVLAHHSRVDVYANYTPSPVCYVAPQVMRLILEVVNMFADGHLLCDPTQAAQPWFQRLPHVYSWDAGCDTVRFHPAKADPKVKAQYAGGRTDLPLVIFVGRMAPEKQVELIPAMIEAVNPPGQKPVCRFALIGGGPSADFIRAATAGRDDVVMPGIVRGEDLAKCFASADLFFTPTVTGTLDLVFLEAMASGLPVVGPRAVAIPHVLTNGVNGQLYDVCDAADAARAIREALPLVDTMKPTCREIAEQRFTYSAMVRRAVDVYGYVLGEETPPPQ